MQSILDNAVANWPDRPALDFMGKRISYRELGRWPTVRRAGLQKLGVGPGVHVGLYLPNTPHYVIAFFGVLKAGGTVVNYSPLDAAKVLEHKIEDSRTDILVTLDLASLYPQMAAMLGKTRLKTLVVGRFAEMTARPDAVERADEGRRQLSRSRLGRRAMSLRRAARQRRRLPRPIRSAIRPRRSPCCNIPAARRACPRARC